MAPTLLSLLPLLPFLAAVSASPSYIATPHDAPSFRDLIRLTHPPSSNIPACVNEAYFGAYGGVGAEQDHLYYPETLCLQSMAEWYDNLSSETREPQIRTYNPKADGEEAFEYLRVATTMPGGHVRYFWVGPAGVEPALRVREEKKEGSEEQRFRIQDGQSGDVPPLDSDYPAANLQGAYSIRSEADNIRQGLWKIAHEHLPEDMKSMTSFPGITVYPISSSSHIITVPGTIELTGLLDTVLPSHLVPVSLPSMSLREIWQIKGREYVTEFEDERIAEEGKSKVAAFAVPVPKERAAYLRNITEALKFDPKLDRLIEEGLDAEQLRRDIRWLTGEAPSGWESRHSFTQGARDAAAWIKESTGANCTLQPFLPGFSPNIICKYPSNSSLTSDSVTSESVSHKETKEEHVIFSAHYDSRGSFGLTAAPGGDDDGSGSGHLLAIARAIGKMGVRFEKDVTLAWFAGEEQGLLGSRAYAEKLYQQNATVLLQVQADMLGYHVPGEPLQLGLPETIALPEASSLLSTLARMYAPELVVGTTAACCSDHQSFLGLGFPSTQVFERNGWIADPMYHNSGDESAREGYDFDQVRAIGKVTMAALMTVGEWSA